MEEKARTCQVVWAEHARTALLSVAEYIRQDSPFYADKVFSEIRELANSVYRSPFGYPECPELPTKNHVYRKAVYASTYKIIYKIVKQEIWVLEIFHGKRSPVQLKKLRRVKP